ncbi:MAG TPA: glutaredoxin domain-containing protein, partial [Candidatus Saccharimonadales bacterium]|nr:glutaredoxin domain-containing protein [Candidatus Saccharimonadales bacterium]
MKENIIVYGADWCADCHRARYLFDKHGVKYEYKDVDSDPQIMNEMLSLADGKNIIPTIQFGDGSVLQEPSNDELLKKLGLAEDSPMKNSHDVVMVGAGPAALTAAIYTTREDIDTVLFERGVVGGLAAVTDKIDNYPGFPDGVEGLTLADALQKQAERFGAAIELGDVLKIHDEGMYKRLETTDGDYFARAVLIATGSDYKKIG